MMTQMELIDRLCAVNTLLTDIVREQAAIMAQHGIEEIQTISYPSIISVSISCRSSIADSCCIIIFVAGLSSSA